MRGCLTLEFVHRRANPRGVPGRGPGTAPHYHLRPPVGSPLVSEIEFANKKVGTILPSNRKKKTSTPTARGQPRGAETPDTIKLTDFLQ